MGIWVEPLSGRLMLLPNSGSGGVSDFLSLSDTPSSFVGEAGKGVRVNVGESALEFYSLVVDTDEKVKVSSNDTTAGFLNGKLVAGTGIILTELNDGGDETLSVVSNDSEIVHSNLSGLTTGDAGHTQFVMRDGTTALTANWDVGSFKITAETFESDVTTGTSPFTVASTTVVINLNADKLDGYDAGDMNYSFISGNDASTDVTASELEELSDGSETSLHIHDGRYYTETEIDTMFSNGTIDHGNLSGLTNDDHTQYVYLEGRSGGQTIYGGTDEKNDLVLFTTSNITKGLYRLGDLTDNGIICTKNHDGTLSVDTTSYAPLSSLNDYIKKDGTTDLTGNWTISNNSITLTNGTMTANSFIGGSSSITSSITSGNVCEIVKSNTTGQSTGLVISHDLPLGTGKEYALRVQDHSDATVMSISSKGAIAIGTGTTLYDYLLTVKGTGTQFLFMDVNGATVVQMADNAITFNEETTINDDLNINGGELAFNSAGSIVIDSKNVLTYSGSERYLWTDYIGTSTTGSGTFYIFGDEGGNIFKVTGDPNNNDDLIRIGDVDVVGNRQYLEIDGSVPKFTFVGGDVIIEEDLTVDNDATFSGEVKGSKVLLGEAFYESSTTSSQYLTNAIEITQSSTYGCIMPRAGSITDISVVFVCTSGGIGRELIAQVRKNGTNVFSKTVSCATTGTKTGYATQARDTDSFRAGDVISGYIDLGSMAPTVRGIQLQIWGYFDD